MPGIRSSTGLRHLVIPYQDPRDLGRLRPAYAKLAESGREAEVDPVCAFALDAGAVRDGAVASLRARDFCSPVGDDEEPASGTTSGARACYLYRHGARRAWRRGAAVALSVRMGVGMGRPGRVEPRLGLGEGGEGRCWGGPRAPSPACSRCRTGESGRALERFRAGQEGL